MAGSLSVRVMMAGTLVLAAVGCGNSGATAELNLMDAPPQGVIVVKVTVASVQAHVAASDQAKDADPNDSSIDDDGKWVSLPVHKTIDLVQHQGETAAEKLGQLDLPQGKITQLRLVLDTTAPANNIAMVNGQLCALGVEKVAKKGIKIDHVFKAFDSKPGSTEQVWIDFRLDESLTPNNGGCYDLDPHLQLAHVKTDGLDVKLK